MIKKVFNCVIDTCSNIYGMYCLVFLLLLFLDSVKLLNLTENFIVSLSLGSLCMSFHDCFKNKYYKNLFIFIATVFFLINDNISFNLNSIFNTNTLCMFSLFLIFFTKYMSIKQYERSNIVINSYDEKIKLLKQVIKISNDLLISLKSNENSENIKVYMESQKKCNKLLEDLIKFDETLKEDLIQDLREINTNESLL